MIDDVNRADAVTLLRIDCCLLLVYEGSRTNEIPLLFY